MDERLERSDNMTIELDENYIYIGEENSSGCKYPYKTKQDIIDAFTDYVNNYITIERSE